MRNYQKITKKNTKTFYYSTVFFPKKIKEKVFLLYSFVRIIDDFVDKKNPDKKNFYLYKQELKNLIEKNKRSKIKIINDIGKLIKENKIKKEIYDYLKTQEKELIIKKYKKIKDFNQFAYGVAGTIGIIMAKLLKLPKNTYKDAKNVGISLQIINNVRDIYEDYKIKKFYLPEELLKKYNLNHKNFLKKENENKLNQIIYYLIKKSFLLEKKAKKSYKFFKKNILFPIKIAISLYQDIAKKIVKNPKLIFHKEKLKITKFQILKTIINNFLIIYGFNRKN
ncbi:MAG: squalene/phytoene synthase family protein [Patescibacteria group bacterium]|nr:squalene/phytoene synthase family protein [Patescibacteria group bacterium]